MKFGDQRGVLAFAALSGTAAKAPVKLLIGHEDWIRDSDHYAFIQAKIPALYFGVEDFAQHHKATDDYETITYGFYVRAVETLVQVVQRFDGNLGDLLERSAEPR